jgi:tRNA(Ile2) C34 agmatinyltransferase TiaS
MNQQNFAPIVGQGMFRCANCRGRFDAVFRVNAKGADGIFHCRRCLTTPPDPEVDEIVRLIEDDNARR